MLLILGPRIEFFVDEPDLAALGPQGRPGRDRTRHPGAGESGCLMPGKPKAKRSSATPSPGFRYDFLANMPVSTRSSRGSTNGLMSTAAPAGRLRGWTRGLLNDPPAVYVNSLPVYGLVPGDDPPGFYGLRQNEPAKREPPSDHFSPW